MALEHATAFSMRGQTYRVFVSFRDASNTLITGWTGAASSISKDFGAAAAGAAPVEIGTTGMGYLELDATAMTATHVAVTCTVSNAGAKAFVGEVRPLVQDPADRADAGTIRFENAIWNLWQYWMNRVVADYNQSKIFIYKADQTTVAFEGSIQFTSSSNLKGHLS